MTRIYTLSTPNDNIVYYVGATRLSLKERLSAHVRMPINETTYSIVESGGLPVIEELEQIENKLTAQTEGYWIYQFRAWGFKLENKRDRRVKIERVNLNRTVSSFEKKEAADHFKISYNIINKYIKGDLESGGLLDKVLSFIKDRRQKKGHLNFIF